VVKCGQGLHPFDVATSINDSSSGLIIQGCASG
jgi:hypothetical protein